MRDMTSYEGSKIITPNLRSRCGDQFFPDHVRFRSRTCDNVSSKHHLARPLLRCCFRPQRGGKHLGKMLLEGQRTLRFRINIRQVKGLFWRRVGRFWWFLGVVWTRVCCLCRWMHLLFVNTFDCICRNRRVWRTWRSLQLRGFGYSSKHADGVIYFQIHTPSQGVVRLCRVAGGRQQQRADEHYVQRYLE